MLIVWVQYSKWLRLLKIFNAILHSLFSAAAQLAPQLFAVRNNFVSLSLTSIHPYKAQTYSPSRWIPSKSQCRRLNLQCRLINYEYCTHTIWKNQKKSGLWRMIISAL